MFCWLIRLASFRGVCLSVLLGSWLNFKALLPKCSLLKGIWNGDPFQCEKPRWDEMRWDEMKPTVDGRNPKQPPGMCSFPVNNGMNYLSSGAGFLPSTVWQKQPTNVFLCFLIEFITASQHHFCKLSKYIYSGEKLIKIVRSNWTSLPSIKHELTKKQTKT